MSISKIKENARIALTGKWGKGVCILLAYLLVVFGIGIINGLLPFGGIIALVVEIPIAFGIAYSFIKLKRGEEVGAFEFLELGFSNFGRSWKIALRTILKLIKPIIFLVISLLIIIAGVIGVGVSVYNMSAVSSIEPDSIGFLLLILVGYIGYLVSIIWLAISSLFYSLTTYVAYDNSNMTALEVVNESKRMMKGNRFKIFLLELSFIGWAILATLTFGIGYLWLLPYITVAEICFYEYLCGKSEIENSDDNVEAIKEM